MSRGHGKAQRFILECLERHAEIEGGREYGFLPIGSLASFYAKEQGVPNSATLHRSLRRAAWALYMEDELCIEEEAVPTRVDVYGEPVPGSARRVMCVGLPCDSYAVEPILLAALLYGVGSIA